MEREKRKTLVELHTELLDIAKEVVQRHTQDRRNIDNPKFFSLIIAVYDKLFSIEMQKANFQFQKGMMSKIPDVSKLLSNVLGSGE